jgi:hypothetical protein
VWLIGNRKKTRRMFSSSRIWINLVYGNVPTQKASQIRSETGMVRKSIGEMIPENIWTRIETVAVSVSGMVHTRKDRMPKSPTKKSDLDSGRKNSQTGLKAEEKSGEMRLCEAVRAPTNFPRVYL